MTDSYHDTVTRLESLRKIKTRYEELLNKAIDVKDMLTIERELERIDLEIDRLEGRKKYAEQTVAYSLVSVHFGKKTRPGPLGWVFYGLYRGIKWLFVWD
ncbi:DUF4349 domain-containing protein [Brucepastera parasyntrophica]|uniref:DUF4349 domain-containing protein n=1 Tax=Brucepastera parasyntrophica TaxID=2880008 RepID=UPI00210AE308|nr:DUF4349 domain-containing protein [Brucepastera parasyntrophica]ULQ61140.1 DUF4349 domain-containing protein [Brucepastera parasyntrophica]